MPIYVYRCKTCGFEREILRLKPTPDSFDLSCKCGKRMKRVPAAAAIQFRGSGWTEKGPGRRG